MLKGSQCLSGVNINVLLMLRWSHYLGDVNVKVVTM